MSQYKSAVRSQQGTSKSSPYHEKTTQLHELFPDLQVDELESILTEVNGDAQLAALRITDGALQPWEVSRKKDKKPPTTHNQKSSTASRGDSRGARAGRGGRVGARGRGGHPKSSGNGHVPQAESTFISSWDDPPNGTAEWGKSDSFEQISKSTNASHGQQNGISPSTSGKISQTENTTLATSSWGHTLEGGANGSTSQTTHPPAIRQPSKTPATSKLSWAQIARSQEKTATVAPLPTQFIPPPVQEAVPESELDAEAEEIGREEPTTVEGPTWDDSKLSAAETWPPTDVTTEVAQVQPPQVVTLEGHPEALELAPKAIEPGDANQEPTSAFAPVVATPSPSSQPQVLVTSSPKLSSRPAVSSHRSSARYKVTDQPVTLPLSFGAGVEKVGMQFGSLSVGDPSATETSQHETEAPAPVAELTPIPQSKVEASAPHPPPATAPPTSTSLSSMFQQQHGPSVSQSQQSQNLPSVQSSIPHHTLPTSISQPIASNQTNVHTPTPSSLHQFSQQQTSAQQQQQPTPTHNVAQHQSQHQMTHLQPQSQHAPHLPQQLQQNQPVHTLNQQQAMLVHLDQTPQTQTQQSTAHSTYFRGSDTSATTGYFHAPTPPVAQAQDSSYGSFGQLANQGQHQQASHSNTFGSNDYSYNERFYESYTAQQQQGFGNRNPLGHDDIKVIPGGQQNAASSLPPSATQGPQPHSAQTSSQQAQPTSGQGPQTYPPPVPYYFPHAYPQNQYYGTPYSSGYVPQPFVKYPTMFQAGPPGPGSAGNPAAKQPGNVGVQPQTPYNGSLYQQAGYEDYQTHQHSQHQHQHSHNLGLGQGMSDYSKQLYGAGQGSMQGFMGLGGQNSSGGTGPASNAGPRSPEASYKPYVKDNVTRSGQSQQGQGQVPPQSQVQGPNGQGSTGQNFYGGNRFGAGGASSSSVSGGPQQGGQQGHLGYPQGVNEANFYGYQPRQQQGYWQ